MTKRPSKKNSPIGIDELLSTKIREKPPILINGVLPAGGNMILGGESEVGKSLMRMEWSILLAVGLPIYGMKTPHAQTILIFQTENRAKAEQERAQKIMDGYDIESCFNRVHWARAYRKPSLLNDAFLNHAEEQIKKCDATVVWWDPLVSFHNKNENDNVAMRNVLDCISYLNHKTGAASIVIHHFGQPASKQKDEIPLRYRLRGASSIRDWADTIITLRATGEKKERLGSSRMLDFIKIRNGPPRAPLYLERNGNFVHTLTEEQRTVPLALVKEIVKHQGKEIDSQNQLIKEIRKRVDCSRGSAFNAIRECMELGYIWEKNVDGIRQFGAKL